MNRLLRNLVLLIGACLLGAGSLVMTASPASADAVQTFRNQATNRCLDDSG